MCVYTPCEVLHNIVNNNNNKDCMNIDYYLTVRIPT